MARRVVQCASLVDMPASPSHRLLQLRQRALDLRGLVFGQLAAGAIHQVGASDFLRGDHRLPFVARLDQETGIEVGLARARTTR